jgi:hypothetical protein
MAQTVKVIPVTVAVPGTAQRVVTTLTDPNRFVPWAYFEALSTNAGLIYVGDDDVTDENYMAMLNGAGNDRSFNWNAFKYPCSPQPQIRNQNLLDLYNVWVDSSQADDVVFVSVPLLILD